jgi:hypothetical protein
MSQKYISLATSLCEGVAITPSQLKQFHTISGAHNVPARPGSDWPDPEKLYSKFTAVKSKLMNLVMPFCPKEVQDIKNLPSGRGLMEYVKKWQMEIYINDTHAKVAMSKKLPDRTKELIRQEIGNSPSNVPMEWILKNTFPQSTFLTACCFMHHPILSVTHSKEMQNEHSINRLELRSNRYSSGSGSGSYPNPESGSIDEHVQRTLFDGIYMYSDRISYMFLHHSWKKFRITSVLIFV